jgi:molybdopterin molybdotransferase
MAGEPIGLDAARDSVLSRVRPLGPETVQLEHALRRVLAEPVIAADPVPGFDNSAMDGFAVRAGDARAPGARLAIAGEAAAGRPWSGELEAGQAVAISTGAVLPAGADAVVRVEDTARDGAEVELRVAVESGANVRRAGEDMVAGQTVLEPGAELGPAELGVIAAAGRAAVACSRRPRFHLLATGSELQPPGEPLRPGGVRNSNAHSVGALAAESGAEVVATETVADSAEDTRDALAGALRGADVVVACGGVSVGEHDHVKGALAALGVEEVFWRVALRPGKPTWFGVGPEGTAVFGLPGNPVSAMVTFICFARPAIRAMLGARELRATVTAILDESCRTAGGRAELLRCRLELRDDGWHARPASAQGSHVLTSMLGADGLALLPADATQIAAGERVAVELLRWAPTIRG